MPNTARVHPISDVFLNNNGTSATVLSGIRDLVVAEGGLDVAVSYIQVSGWQALAGIIHRLAPNRVRILVTDHFDLTHPKALQLALNRGVQFRRYAGNRIYHPKVYLARNRSNDVTGAVAGSANVSDSGLSDGIEAAVVVEDFEVLTAIDDWFDELWNATQNAIEVDATFISEYRLRWRTVARARVKLRRFRRRKITGIVVFTNEHPEDIEVLEDLCETIRVPIAILSMDQAKHKVRNLNRLLAVLKAFPDIHGKALSELRLLGLAEGVELTAIGLQCQRCTTTRALARAWCRWVKDASEQALLEINPNIAEFRRAATLFWKLRREVRSFFFQHLEVREQRDALMAIELLCSAGDAVRELKIEDFRALAPILASPRKVPKHLCDAIREYHENKRARSWTGDDRQILLEAWRDVC